MQRDEQTYLPTHLLTFLALVYFLCLGTECIYQYLGIQPQVT